MIEGILLWVLVTVVRGEERPPVFPRFYTERACNEAKDFVRAASNREVTGKCVFDGETEPAAAVAGVR
jgi:hypothetical protein